MTATIRPRLRDVVALRRQRVAQQAARAVLSLDHAGSADLGAQLEVEEALRELRTYGDLERLLDEYRHVASPYQRAAPWSILADLLYGAVDRAAGRRLAEHQALMPSFERRDLGSGALAGLTVPQYLVDDAAPAARAEAPLVGLLVRPLPDAGMEVDLARWTTLAVAEAQSGENVAATEQNPATALVQSPVRTYEVRVDTSRQVFDRVSQAVDAQILPDLVAAVDVRIDFDVINGPGTSGRLTGILSTGGVGSQTYTDATPTVGEFVPNLEAAYRTSAAARGAPPNLAIMHSRRFSWLRQGLAVDSGLGGANLLSDPRIPQAVATYGDLQVIVDDSIPTNLGAGTNEDRVIIARDDVLRLHLAPSAVLLDEQSQAGNLNVVVVPYRYAAFTAARLPASVVVIAGTGLVPPTP